MIPLAAFVFAGLILAKNLATATPSDRQRLGFLALGTFVSFVAYAIYFIPGVPFAVGQVVGFAVVLMPLCIAYAVFRLRVLNVNFVLNRALVFGVLSVGVIAFVSVLDWFFSRVVALGGSQSGSNYCDGRHWPFLDRINRWVEGLVETVFFRRRRCGKHLRRAACRTSVRDRRNCDHRWPVQVPVDALELAAAALYWQVCGRRGVEGVATSRRRRWPRPLWIDNALLVRMLLADENIVWLDDLRSHLDAENAAIYTLAVPVTVRHELVSFTLYGAHANGAQLDPDEVELLEELAAERLVPTTTSRPSAPGNDTRGSSPKAGDARRFANRERREIGRQKRQAMGGLFFAERFGRRIQSGGQTSLPSFTRAARSAPKSFGAAFFRGDARLRLKEDVQSGSRSSGSTSWCALGAAYCRDADLAAGKEERALRQHAIVSQQCLEQRPIRDVAARLGISYYHCYRQRAEICRRVARYICERDDAPSLEFRPRVG